MAIYVKRESAIADTIQSPDDVGVDLNQIEKDIAGPKGIAAHEEEIEDAVEGVIDDPAKGLMDGCDIAESCYMALYESEYNFNKIIECIDIHTLRAASMDRDLVLEAGDIKGFFNTIKEAIISAFKKFTEVITTIINKIKSVFVDNKKFVAVNSSAIEKGFEKMKTHNEEIMGIPYNHTALANLVESFKNADGYKYSDASVEYTKNKSRNAGDDSDNRDAAYTAYTKEIINCFIKSTGAGGADVDKIASIGDLTKAIEIAIIGKDKVNLKTHYNSAKELMDIITSDSSKEISNSYNIIKNSINDRLKKLDEQAKNASNAEGGKDKEGYTARDFKFTANCIKFYQQAVQQICMLVSRLKVNEIAQARSYATRCINASGEKYHESVEFEESTPVSESSVFASIDLI